jgi:hypothetical protein
VALVSGCDMKVKYLPQIAAPYISEVGFFKQVQQDDNGIKKIFFKDRQIRIPFTFYLKIENIEDSGQIKVVFYGKKSGSLLEYGKRTLLITREYILWRVRWLSGTSPPAPSMDRDWSLSRGPGFVDRLHSLMIGWFKTLATLVQFPMIFNPGHFNTSYLQRETELNFRFGEDGKYYEYVIFIDKVRHMEPGMVRYGIFLNGNLMYQGDLTVSR